MGKLNDEHRERLEPASSCGSCEPGWARWPMAKPTKVSKRPPSRKVRTCSGSEFEAKPQPTTEPRPPNEKVDRDG